MSRANTQRAPCQLGAASQGWSKGVGGPAFYRSQKREGGGAIQRFADDVSMTCVSCRLFAEMEQDPADRPGVNIAGEPWNILRNWYGLPKVGDSRDDPLCLRGDLIVELEDAR